MLGVFERAGFELTRKLSSGVVEVEFPIASTEQFEQSVEERDHTAVVASLRPFFEPASVAVVGASSRRGTIGGELFRNVLQGDFAGAAYPVNPKGAAVAGVRGYRVGGGDPGSRRPGGDLGARASTCSARPRTRSGAACGRSS